MFVFVKIKLDCSQIWFLAAWGVLGGPKRGKNTFKLGDGHAGERVRLALWLISFLQENLSLLLTLLAPVGGGHLQGKARGLQKGSRLLRS